MKIKTFQQNKDKNTLLNEFKVLNRETLQKSINEEITLYEEKDSDNNIVYREYTNPLALAAELRDLKSVQLFLNLGAEPNAPVSGYRQKYTALQMLLWKNSMQSDNELTIEIIHNLVNAGADVNFYHVGNGYNWSPLQIADQGASSYPPSPVLGRELLKLGAIPPLSYGCKQYINEDFINLPI
jgi:ankyrin repeat protein